MKVEHFVTHYNTVCLHSAIGYITPVDRLTGRHLQIFAARDKKLDAARQDIRDAGCRTSELNRKESNNGIRKSLIMRRSISGPGKCRR